MESVAQYLINYNKKKCNISYINLQNKNKKTAYDYALMNGMDNICETITKLNLKEINPSNTKVSNTNGLSNTIKFDNPFDNPNIKKSELIQLTNWIKNEDK